MGVATKDQLEQAIEKQDKMIEAYKLLNSEKLGATVEECLIINSTLNIAEVLESIMRYANRVTNSVASTLMLLDEETGELVFSVPTGPKSDKLTDFRLPPGEGITGWVAENGQHLLIPDVKKDKRFYGQTDEMSGFETKPGEGTMFTIVLPKGKEEIDKEDEKLDPVVEIRESNIMIIDDEPEIGVLLSEILSNQGHQTCVFDNGIGGIEAFKKGSYEILITDLGMPGVSGWEVINIVRQIKPGVVIGIITGWDVSEEEAKQKGVDFLIKKPFRADYVLQVVTNAVESKAG